MLLFVPKSFIKCKVEEAMLGCAVIDKKGILLKSSHFWITPWKRVCNAIQYYPNPPHSYVIKILYAISLPFMPVISKQHWECVSRDEGQESAESHNSTNPISEIRFSSWVLLSPLSPGEIPAFKMHWDLERWVNFSLQCFSSSALSGQTYGLAVNQTERTQDIYHSLALQTSDFKARYF